MGHEVLRGRRGLRVFVAAICIWPFVIGVATAGGRAYDAFRSSGGLRAGAVLPLGTVKLPAGAIRHLTSAGQRFACGKWQGQWRSGNALPGSHFISYTQRAADVTSRAKTTKSLAVRRQDLRLARQYRGLARVRDPLCHGRVTLTNPQAQNGRVGSNASLTIYGRDSDGGALRYAATNLPPGLGIAAGTGSITGQFTRGGDRTVKVTATDVLSGAQSSVSFSWSVTTPPHLTPVHFRLRGAVGLVLRDSRSASAARMLRSRTDSLAPSPVSNLEVVTANGQLTDALDTTGSVVVSNFLIAPNNTLYVLFQEPVDLATSAYDPNGCLLAQVAPATGDPTCIDNTLATILWTDSQIPGEQPIQFDSSGAIYYEGITTAGLEVLRKYSDGTTTDLITADDFLEHFLALPDGTVIVSGTSDPTQLKWTRSISPSGHVTNLTDTDSNFLSQFPDGNAYMGTSWKGTGPLDPGVARYIAATAQMDPKYWIAYPIDSTQDYFSSNQICADPNLSRLKTSGFCSMNGSFLRWAFSSTNGAEYAVPDEDHYGIFMQYYPTVSFLPTEVTDVTVAQGFANDVLLAGTTADGTNVLTLYDTTSNTEQELLGADDEVEIYHLSFDAATDTVLFDGLRFADNKYVIGEYNLGTRQVNTVASSTEDWADAQSFGQ
jgi:hypothetical protein